MAVHPAAGRLRPFLRDLGHAVAVAETGSAGLEAAAGDNIDRCRQASGSTAIPPGCDAFRNTCAGYTMEIENLYDVSQIELGPLIPDGKPLPVIAVGRARPAEDT
jgi:hypothetical protein